MSVLLLSCSEAFQEKVQAHTRVSRPWVIGPAVITVGVDLHTRCSPLPHLLLLSLMSLQPSHEAFSSTFYALRHLLMCQALFWTLVI